MRYLQVQKGKKTSHRNRSSNNEGYTPSLPEWRISYSLKKSPQDVRTVSILKIPLKSKLFSATQNYKQHYRKVVSTTQFFYCGGSCLDLNVKNCQINWKDLQLFLLVQRYYYIVALKTPRMVDYLSHKVTNLKMNQTFSVVHYCRFCYH